MTLFWELIERRPFTNFGDGQNINENNDKRRLQTLNDYIISAGQEGSIFEYEDRRPSNSQNDTIFVLFRCKIYDCRQTTNIASYDRLYEPKAF